MDKEWENAVRMARRLGKAKDRRAAVKRLLQRQSDICWKGFERLRDRVKRSAKPSLVVITGGSKGSKA